jgi:hypothetical protein
MAAPGALLLVVGKGASTIPARCSSIAASRWIASRLRGDAGSSRDARWIDAAVSGVSRTAAGIRSAAFSSCARRARRAASPARTARICSP